MITSRMPLAALAALMITPACGDDGTSAMPDTAGDTQSPHDTQSPPDTQSPDVEPTPGFEIATSAYARNLEPAANNDTLRELVNGNTTFALDLYTWLRNEDPNENLFYSPHSISVALAMTYAGARGTSATEMADTLHFTLENDALHDAFNRLALTLDARENVEVPEGDPFALRVTNSIWGLAGYPYGQPFLDTLARHYGAPMYLVDFIGDAEGARQTINAWVADATKDLIGELLPEGIIKPTTRLVLTNAIYFFAGWQSPFDKALTAKAPFTNLDGSTSEVDLMTLRNAELPYAEVDGHRVVDIPYVGGDVSMLVILPAEGQFASFESTLDSATLATLTSALSHAAGRLRMPKLELKSQLKLSKPLEELGMPSCFGNGADFTGIATAENLFIQDVVHEGIVKIDEEGTEAAAATAVIVGTDSEPVSTFDLTIDRPYLFVIRDRPTGAILFVGRVVSH